MSAANTAIALARFASVMAQPAIDKNSAIHLSASVVSAALIAEATLHTDVSFVMNQLAAAVALSPETGLAMAAEAMTEACLTLAGKLPASSKELQGRGADAVASKVFGRLRSRFNRRGIDFSAAKGELVAKLMRAKKPGKGGQDEENKGGQDEENKGGQDEENKGGEGGEGENSGLTLAPTLAQCAAIVSAASKTDASELAALLVKCGFDFGAVASAALANAA